MATMQVPKPLALRCQGRVALLDRASEVHFRDISALRAKLGLPMDCTSIGSVMRSIACTPSTSEAPFTPMKDMMEYLLCVIDLSIGGDGEYQSLLDGTSKLYDEGHLWPTKGINGVPIYMLDERYAQFYMGTYARGPIRVSMHRLMCWLRWGNPPEANSIVCHDIGCPRRTPACVSLGCLRWGDRAANARDRVEAHAYRNARQGRAPASVAQASECSLLHACNVRYGGAWQSVSVCCEEY